MSEPSTPHQASTPASPASGANQSAPAEASGSGTHSNAGRTSQRPSLRAMAERAASNSMAPNGAAPNSAAPTGGAAPASARPLSDRSSDRPSDRPSGRQSGVPSARPSRVAPSSVLGAAGPTSFRPGTDYDDEHSGLVDLKRIQEAAAPVPTAASASTMVSVGAPDLASGVSAGARPAGVSVASAAPVPIAAPTVRGVAPAAGAKTMPSVFPGGDASPAGALPLPKSEANAAPVGQGGASKWLLVAGILLVGGGAAFALIGGGTADDGAISTSGPTPTVNQVAPAAASAAPVPTAEAAPVAAIPSEPVAVEPSANNEPTKRSNGIAGNGTATNGTASKALADDRAAAPASPDASAAKPVAPAAPPVPKSDLERAIAAAAGPIDRGKEVKVDNGTTPVVRNQNIPEIPAQGTLNSAMASVRPNAKACVAGATDATKAVVTFGSSGKATAVDVSGWAASNGKAACVKAALMKANVGAFSKPSYAFPYTIRP
jgi:hypothetical protein